MALKNPKGEALPSIEGQNCVLIATGRTPNSKIGLDKAVSGERGGNQDPIQGIFIRVSNHHNLFHLNLPGCQS